MVEKKAGRITAAERNQFAIMQFRLFRNHSFNFDFFYDVRRFFLLQVKGNEEGWGEETIEIIQSTVVPLLCNACVTPTTVTQFRHISNNFVAF